MPSYSHFLPQNVAISASHFDLGGGIDDGTNDANPFLHDAAPVQTMVNIIKDN